jgi:hypothetical protein
MLYKCPECNKTTFKNSSKLFTSWKDVSKHYSLCSSSKEYYIDFYYGPILFADINRFKTRKEFLGKYPSSSLTTGCWSHYRATKKITINSLGYWNVDNIIVAIQNFVKLYNRIPEGKDFNHSSTYPSTLTVRKYFGTWNNAITKAGFDIIYRDQYGTPTKANDGVIYRSQAEAYFVNQYLIGKYDYQYEIPYGNGWYYDFYLPELNLYIELDGNCRPHRIQEKIKYHKDHHISNFKVIPTDIIYTKNLTLEQLFDIIAQC